MMPMRARDVCRMGQSHRPPPGIGVSAAVRQELFALGFFHCSTTLWDLTNMEQESWREMESPSAIKAQSFCDSSIQIVVKKKSSL